MEKQRKGVADNKSYKDQYHFNGKYTGSNTPDDLPSVNVDPAINDKIKENPYRSNVEIEGDEIVLKGDLSALFKAQGKKHSQGGMDVMLDPDSFVFSDDKSMAFNDKDNKLFEFKKGGSVKPEKNTPAEVVKRNVDPKHYNKLISNVTDIKKDDLAKRSSSMMLEKYMDTLGQIAYVQESKKNFPDGIPDFAVNTAPVYKPEVKNEVMAQKQYAKYGGKIRNPYKMADGGYAPGDWDMECPCGRNPVTHQCLPCGPGQTTAAAPFFSGAPVVTTPPSNYNLIASANGSNLYSNSQYQPGSGQMMGNQNWLNFLSAETPEHKATRLARQTSSVNDQFVKTQPPRSLTMPPQMNVQITPGQQSVDNPIPTPNTVTGPTQAGKNVDWQFSPWQRLSQGYNLAKLVTAKRYMPYRSHLNPSLTDASLVNPEQAISDVQGSANQQIQSLGSLSPILRNAQASAYSGQVMDRLPGIRSQYDNQNAQIINQNRSINNQTVNQARQVNMGNDQNYYQQTITGQQNFDNLRSFLGDQYMNNVNQDVQDNQSLAYNLASLNNPAYSYDFKTGNFSRNPKNILDVESGGRNDIQNQYLNKLMGSWETLDNKDRINLLKIMTAKGFTPSTQKKGGKIGRNPYK